MIVKEVLKTKSGGSQVVMTPFFDWCDHMKRELFKVLGDAENLAETMTGQSRSDWTEEEAEAFNKIRTRL